MDKRTSSCKIKHTKVFQIKQKINLVINSCIFWLHYVCDNHFTFVINVSKGIKNILLDILNLIDKSEEFI